MVARLVFILLTVFLFLGYTFTIALYTWTVRDELDLEVIYKMIDMIKKIHILKMSINKDIIVTVIAILLAVISLGIILGLVYINMPYIIQSILG